MQLKSLQNIMLYQSNVGMDTIILVLFILVLAVYIVYLQIQVHKKNIFLNSIARIVRNMNKNWDSGDLLKFLSKLHPADINTHSTNNRIFDNKMMNYIFNDENETDLLSHYTKEETIADTIVKEGFRFIDSFYKTTNKISGNNNIGFIHTHNQRRQYGDFIIILGISKTLYDNFALELQQAQDLDLSVEHILSEETVKHGVHDTEYLLPNQYVKGYIDLKQGKIVHNLTYQPTYYPKSFDEKLVFFKSKTNN